MHIRDRIHPSVCYPVPMKTFSRRIPKLQKSALRGSWVFIQTSADVPEFWREKRSLFEFPIVHMISISFSHDCWSVNEFLLGRFDGVQQTCIWWRPPVKGVGHVSLLGIR